MKYQGHLYLDEALVQPSVEWAVPFPDWCFLRVSDGQGYWLGDGSPQQLSPGDMIVLLPSRHGLFRASQLGPVRIHYFRFCPDLLGGFLSLAERHALETLAAKAECGMRFLPATHPAAVHFTHLGEKATSGNGLLRRCLVLQVAGTAFIRELSTPRTRDAVILTASKRIKVLMNQLTEAEVLNFSSADLAARCGCSIRHFSRLFLSCFTVSFRSKQTALRLAKARQLLAETNMKVMDVARASGYRHLGLFNASFKKRFGLTPTECRQPTTRRAPRPKSAPPKPE